MKTIEARREIAAAPRMFPSGGMVPANLLRLHIIFQQSPDMEAVAASARLIDEAGAEVPYAFLDLPGGLWNADGRILTLLLHPGRIKSGLALHEAVGKALIVGQDYEIEVTEGGHRHRFPLVVGEPVTSGFDPGSWILDAPVRDCRQPIAILFDRAMDWMGLTAGLAILDEAGVRIAGLLTVANDGHSALFTPDAPWTTELVTLAAAPDLEDVAGNRVASAFEALTVILD